MEDPNKHPRGLLHAWRATGIALQGLRAAWRHEDAFRQEVLIAAVAIPVALWLPASPPGKALMISSILLVLIVELLNSALESAVDHTSLEQHPLAKRAKDIASAAVLLSIVNALAVWGLVICTSSLCY
ncbi:MAG: Diacylglycerol kinase [Candidatus Gallionella acididurans]|uniref:Diacylglycerol kinase n=1 Tax=Candidatus Gallionella acididurans TaxID=1796491 RepID=A0A139BSK4_9PROT|nr:MAG: Diacylglycerol kinase [Candidatus Gallionella acididurans]